jgi:hypothetical protein
MSHERVDDAFSPGSGKKTLVRIRYFRRYSPGVSGHCKMAQGRYGRSPINETNWMERCILFSVVCTWVCFCCKDHGY